MTLYIGLMSGTSMDGIDAAILDLPSHKLICGITRQYNSELKASIESLASGGSCSLEALCRLNTLIGKEFAAAVHDVLTKSQINASEIKAIGSHGQTVCHSTTSPIPYTLQLGCAHTISSLTGITVVADFRTRDLVNGGQGAPFAPLYHQELLAPLNTPVAVVNIGGIANITLINPVQNTVGWDTGPGNCLMDAWIWTQKSLPYDKSGEWASSGHVIPELLDSLLSDPFFNVKTPKSIGKEYFSLDWLQSHMEVTAKAEDVQATLMTLTAQSIANTLLEQRYIDRLYLCGGGTHNLALHKALSTLLPNISVNSIADIGIPPDFLEAMMFAWLGAQTMNKTPIDLIHITGSNKPAILGAIYPAYK